MKNTNNQPNANPNTPDHSGMNSNTKFIRKSNSQTFNTFQNMLRYKVASQSLEKDGKIVQKQPLYRKTTLENYV
jgi:hypothetical protein